MFTSDYDIIRKTNKISKENLNILYSNIDEYFENCEKYGLQVREGQVNMALSVFDAIESSDNLVIEAGVGIGKSFAYLIPLLYYFSLTNKSFIISTSTIALQEQLEKDIAILSEQLNIELDIVVAKGMSNFICINRLEKYLEQNKDKIKEFNFEKQDRKDYSNIKDNEWKKINVENCLYAKCSNCNTCEFYKRRNLMKSINGAIICNHDLLIEDLSRSSVLYGRQLFKNVAFIVCDEAHNLENKVRSSKTKEIKINSVKEPIKKAISILEKNRNYEYNYDKTISLIEKLSSHINQNVLKIIEELKTNGIEIEDCNGLEFTFDEDVKVLSTNIQNILSEINSSVQLFSDKDTEDLEEQLYEFELMFEVLAAGENGNYLFWIERKGKRNTIYYAPKDINEIAYQLFFYNDEYYKVIKAPSKTFIFTSATLSIGKDDFSYFLQNIGANKVEYGLTVENSYESPYDYDNNALLYSCSDIASPKDKNKYLEQLVEKIKELILITHGKTLVLFTSKNDMKYVYEKIGSKLNDINVYVQNDGSSQDKIKNKFKNDINSVLFSTGIFWEGIDIKGESLSNLIIARLPFPVVNPIMEYKKSLYGDKGFEKVYIPEMLIKLKQGVGRLIRSETDKGIVCILDSRLSKYEKTVKKTLPIKKIVTSIDEVKKFVHQNGIDN